MDAAPPQRLPALSDADLPDNVRDIVSRWNLKLHRTLSHSPDTLAAWLPYAEHVLLKSTLPVRDRELAILRVAVNARCDYEWGQHARLALRLGCCDDADLAAMVRGPDDPRWSAHEAALLRGVDELNRDMRVSDGTWVVLAAGYAPAQLVDYVYLVGQFTLVAMLLNSLAITPEDGMPGLPAGGEG